MAAPAYAASLHGRLHLPAPPLHAEDGPRGESAAGAWRPRRFDKILGAVSPEVAGIRRFGSAALDLAWVAAGRFDGFWEEDFQLWDVAAGIVLVREAGGYVTDFRGGEAGVANGQMLAANDQLHNRLHKLVANALR